MNDSHKSLKSTIVSLIVVLSKNTIVLLIIGSVIGSVGTYYASYKLASDHQEAEKQNVAQALYIDISDISNRFNSSLESANLSEDYVTTSENDRFSFIYYDPRPYYSHDGLYFAYITEIDRFDSDLSADLHDYYKNIMAIEFKRQYIFDHMSKDYDFESLSESEKYYINIYSTSMPKQMEICVKKGEIIKDRLKEKYNVNLEIHTLQ